MKINQLKAGVILSYAYQAVHVLTSLIYTPVMLRLLGQSEYGLYQLVSSVISYLSLLSLGFGSGYMRFYSRYKADDDKDGIARLNGMFLIIFAVISAICLLCGATLIFNAKAVFGEGLTAAELGKAKILMAMLVFNMALTFINSVFTSNITAREKFFFTKIIELLRAIFSPFLTLPLLLLGYGSIAMVAVTSFLTIFSMCMNIGYCFKKLKIEFSFKQFDFGLLKELWAFTFFIFINIIVDRINWSIDKVLLGRMMGTAAVAIYGVAAELNMAYGIFSSSISGVFIPRVNLMVAKSDNNDELTRLFTRVGRIQFIILALIMSGYVLYGKPFISFWAGAGYEEAYQIGLFLMLPVTIPFIQNLGIEIQRAKNKHQVRSVVYLFIALSNIFLSIFCIKKWGASGAAVGTMISLLLGNGLFMNVYYHKKIGIDIIYFWKQIARFVPALAVAVVLGIVVKAVVGCESIVLLGINIVLYCAIYLVSFWLMGMNKEEKILIEGPLNSIGAKLCKK